MCTVRCPIKVDVEDGVVKWIEGNPNDPGMAGRLCAKGSAGLAMLYDYERPQHPMIREGKRGEGKWKKATWDEALDLVADRLKTTRDTHGSDSLGVLTSATFVCLSVLLLAESAGFVVNVGSGYGSIGFPGYCAYSASKFALRGFTEALRRELADTRVSILYFAPRATDTAMNPRHTVREIIGRPAEFYHGLRGRKLDERVADLLRQIELDESFMDRLPGELSGGQKQRICIARALAVEQLPAHRTAWAMTLHKSQGSEFDHVLITLPPGGHPLLSRELLYTGVTRAREQVTVFADEGTIREAVHAVQQRRTGLADALRDG